MITAADIMTDAQVAKLTGISTYIFQQRMRDGFKPGELDFNEAKPLLNCGRRFWFRADVERVIKERIIKQ